MRQNIRYQSLVIPSKIRVEIRLSMDDQHNPLYQGIRIRQFLCFHSLESPLFVKENSEKMENVQGLLGIQMTI